MNPKPESVKLFASSNLLNNFASIYHETVEHEILETTTAIQDDEENPSASSLQRKAKR